MLYSRLLHFSLEKSENYADFFLYAYIEKNIYLWQERPIYTDNKGSKWSQCKGPQKQRKIQKNLVLNWNIRLFAYFFGFSQTTKCNKLLYIISNQHTFINPLLHSPRIWPDVEKISFFPILKLTINYPKNYSNILPSLIRNIIPCRHEKHIYQFRYPPN